jgi:SAM-dependent methyltransferase
MTGQPHESVVFDRAVDYYDQTRGYPPGVADQIAATIARAGSLTPNSRVLEAGVGTGRVALPLAPLVGRYFGIDLSRAMISRLLAKRTDEALYVAEADAGRLPFAARAFDAIIAVHIFHLIPTWRAVLDDMRRVLRPGGVLLHAGDGLNRAFEVLWNVWQPYAAPDEAAAGIPFDRQHNSIIEAGWEQVGEVGRHTFQVSRTPAGYLAGVQRRIWSSMWRMTDEEHRNAVSAVEAAIAEHYPDAEQPRTFEQTFEVKVYRPVAN